MPKMKTNRATAKRFRKTGSGKFRRAKAGLSHGMFNKTRKRRRRLRDNSIVDPTNQKSVRRLLPKQRALEDIVRRRAEMEPPRGEAVAADDRDGEFAVG